MINFANRKMYYINHNEKWIPTLTNKKRTKNRYRHFLQYFVTVKRNHNTCLQVSHLFVLVFSHDYIY